MRVCFNETLFLFGVCVCAFAFTGSPDVFGCPLLSLSAYSSRKDLSLDSEFMGFPCLFRLEANRNNNHAIFAIPHLRLLVSSMYPACFVGTGIQTLIVILEEQVLLTLEPSL